MKWYAENFVTTLQLATIFLPRLSSHSLFMQQTNVHKLARIEKKKPSWSVEHHCL